VLILLASYVKLLLLGMENQTNKTSIYSEELEIDFGNYCRIIWRRRKAFSTIFVAIIVLVIAISFLLPKVYQSSLLITPGRVNNQVVEPQAATIEVFNQLVTLESVAKELGLPTNRAFYLKSQFKIVESGGGLIKVIGFGNNPQTALKLTNEIKDIILARHSDIFQERNKDSESVLQSLSNKIDNLNQQIAQIEQRAGGSLVNLSAADAQLLSSLEVNQGALVIQQQNFINGNYTSSVTAPAVAPIEPIKPNKKLNVTVAAVFGFIISLCYVFMAEHLNNKKKKII
jgi:uncharacterized protein involved in exopolysaccharide biosynthesis